MITQEQWQRYLDNACKEDERKQILAYLQTLTAAELEARLSEGWVEHAAPMPEALAQRLDKRLTEARQQKVLPPVVVMKKQRYWQMIAAACLLPLAGILLWQTQHKKTANTRAIAAAQVLVNTTQHIQKATLKDSSCIWLSPGARLTIPADYNQTQRRIDLLGEAYFEVAKAADKPFTVHTGGIQTTALGTHFNIEYYAGEAAARVSLSDGKVAVRIPARAKADSTVYLLPGKQLTYHKADSSFYTAAFDREQEYSWKNGDVIFNDMPLKDVFNRLELRFHKRVVCTETALQRKHFSATYQQPSLDLILKNIAFVQGFAYQVKKDSIFIHIP